MVKGTVSRDFNLLFDDSNPSGLLINMHNFAYGLDFADIFACAKHSAMSLTPRSQASQGH